MCEQSFLASPQPLCHLVLLASDGEHTRRLQSNGPSPRSHRTQQWYYSSFIIDNTMLTFIHMSTSGWPDITTCNSDIIILIFATIIMILCTPLPPQVESLITRYNFHSFNRHFSPSEFSTFMKFLKALPIGE